MSNNPFLKSKETNNRFNFLDDEDTNKSSFKESSNKSNRKHIEYDASQNSFTQPSRPRDRDREPYRPNNRRNNDYKHRAREPSPPPVVVLDANDPTLFPELTPIKENTTTIFKESTNFKDILTNVIEDEKPKVNPIPPGWVQLSLVNKKTVIEYGPKTSWMIKQEKEEEIQNQLYEDPNYIMFEAIEQMKKSWDRYEKEYDELHGEGAYTERFRLPPVYGPEYDTESEEEHDSQDEDDM